MSDLLLLIHDEKTTTGTTVEWCLSRGVSFIVKVAKDVLASPEQVSSLTKHRGLIVFGGDMETWETEKHPWLKNEKDLVRGFIDQHKQVLGLCLGAQLMAEQAGGEVFPDPNGWELGWIEVDAKDLNRKLTVLAWHSSSFKVQAPCEIIATNQEGQAEAFRVSPKAIGFQFHMEIDEARLAHALAGYEESFKGRVQSVQELREGLLKHHTEVKDWYFKALDHWWVQK